MTEVDEGQEEDDDAQWAEEDQSKENEDSWFVVEEGDDMETYLAYIENEDLGSVETALSNSAFIHRRTQSKYMATALCAMHNQLKMGEGISFDGVRIDTGANRSSVMSKMQYDAYKREFGLKDAKKPTEKMVRGIGGRRKAKGTAMIQIPFPKIGIVIDVELLIIDEDVPSLLCMKDMYGKKMDI